jgi:hypothetical protein
MTRFRRLSHFESASGENWMNTPPPNCSTAGSQVGILPKRRAARGPAYTRAVPRRRERSPLARANSGGCTDGRRRFPPLRSLIFLCAAKAGSPCAPSCGQLYAGRAASALGPQNAIDGLWSGERQIENFELALICRTRTHNRGRITMTLRFAVSWPSSRAPSLSSSAR